MEIGWHASKYKPSMLCNGSKRSPIGLAKNWKPVGNPLDSYTGNIYLSLKNHEFNRLLPPAMKLGQGNIFTGVCALSLSACWDTTIPLHQDQAGTLPPGPGRHPPPRIRQVPLPIHLPDQAGTPQDQAGTPPQAEHIGRYGQRVGGMHPTGMQSCSL